MRALIRLGLVVVGIVAVTAGTGGGDAAGDAAAEVARLKAEIEQLRGRLPDQSHVMKDVGYHFFAYQQTLAGCYSCRTAAEKPYLRPKIPEQPEMKIIDFEPTPAGRE